MESKVQDLSKLFDNSQKTSQNFSVVLSYLDLTFANTLQNYLTTFSSTLVLGFSFGNMNLIGLFDNLVLRQKRNVIEL